MIPLVVMPPYPASLAKRVKLVLLTKENDVLAIFNDLVEDGLFESTASARLTGRAYSAWLYYGMFKRRIPCMPMPDQKLRFDNILYLATLDISTGSDIDLSLTIKEVRLHEV